MFALRALVVWFTFIVAESMNGMVRELLLVPALGNGHAHQVSFAIGCILVLAIATCFIRWINAPSFSQLMQVGLLWLVLTLAFEIGLGRLILGYSWDQIAADYNLSAGGLMPFGLALLISAPLIATSLRAIPR